MQMQVDELQNLADRVHEEYADLARRCLDIKNRVAELDAQLVAETEKMQGQHFVWPCAVLCVLYNNFLCTSYLMGYKPYPRL